MGNIKIILKENITVTFFITILVIFLSFLVQFLFVDSLTNLGIAVQMLFFIPGFLWMEFLIYDPVLLFLSLIGIFIYIYLISSLVFIGVQQLKESWWYIIFTILGILLHLFFVVVWLFGTSVGV